MDSSYAAMSFATRERSQTTDCLWAVKSLGIGPFKFIHHWALAERSISSYAVPELTKMEATKDIILVVKAKKAANVRVGCPDMHP